MLPDSNIETLGHSHPKIVKLFFKILSMYIRKLTYVVHLPEHEMLWLIDSNSLHA